MDCFPQRFLAYRVPARPTCITSELDEGDLPQFNINFLEKLKKFQEILKFCKLIKINQFS